MGYNKAANETCAWLGLVFWSFQLAPQAWQNYKRKSTEGVSIVMLYLWFIGNMLYGAYAVANNLYFGLIIQPQLFALFTLLNILQVFWYRYRWSMPKVLSAGAILCVLYAGLHAGIWKGEEHAIAEHEDRVVTFLGVLPAIFIAVGFFPEFYVCIQEKSVEMSNFFLLLDISGGVFSTLSLAFDRKFDYVASITYLIVVLLDIILALMKLHYHLKGTQGMAHHGEAVATKEVGDSDSSTDPCSSETSVSKSLEEGGIQH